MLASRNLAHNPNTRNQIPSNWLAWGENVAYACNYGGESANTAQMMTNLWNSHSHKENIMNGNFNMIGVGVAYDSASDCAYATQVFARYDNSASSNGSSGGGNSAPAPAQPKPVVTVDVKDVEKYSKSGLNVRSGPGTGYKIVGALSAGDKVTVTATNENGSWSVIGEGKWVSSSYLTAQAPAQKQPEPAKTQEQKAEVQAPKPNSEPEAKEEPKQDKPAVKKSSPAEKIIAEAAKSAALPKDAQKIKQDGSGITYYLFGRSEGSSGQGTYLIAAEAKDKTLSFFEVPRLWMLP